MDICCNFLEITVVRRYIATFPAPSDWDRAAAASKHFNSLAKVHNTGFWFPGAIPETSYVFPTSSDDGS